MSSTSFRPVLDVATRQHGVITRHDLRQAGIGPKAVRGAVRRGMIEPLGRRTFAVAGSPATDRRAVLAACLDAGGVATRGTAAWLHGIEGFGPGDPPSVVVRQAATEYRLGLAEVHASAWLPGDDVVEVDGIPCLSIARTLFSLAGAVPQVRLSAVTDAVDVAVRDGKATDAWLWWLLERIRRRGRNGVAIFEALLVERTGGRITESWLEREFLRILDGAGVARPRCQRRIQRQGAFVARVDFVYEELRLVIEVSGHTHHSSRRQLSADARRRNQLQLAGYRVLEFTYDDLVGAPAEVVADVLAARAASGEALGTV